MRDNLVYTAIAEVGGFEGNLSGVDKGNKYPSAEAILQSPQNSTRVRGLAGADLPRDFFLTSFPLDSYHSERRPTTAPLSTTPSGSLGLTTEITFRITWFTQRFDQPPLG